MNPLLHRVMVALGRQGHQVPIDDTLGAAYRAFQHYQRSHPTAFGPATDILLAEVEGGATKLDQVPKRLGHLVQMVDRLQRENEVEAWVDDLDSVTVVV